MREHEFFVSGQRRARRTVPAREGDPRALEVLAGSLVELSDGARGALEELQLWIRQEADEMGLAQRERREFQERWTRELTGELDRRIAELHAAARLHSAGWRRATRLAAWGGGALLLGYGALAVALALLLRTGHLG